MVQGQEQTFMNKKRHISAQKPKDSEDSDDPILKIQNVNINMNLNSSTEHLKATVVIFGYYWSGQLIYI